MSELRFNCGCAIPGLQRDLGIVPTGRHGIDLPLEKTFS